MDGTLAKVVAFLALVAARLLNSGGDIKPLDMAKRHSDWIQYDVKARPEAAEAMRAMAERINGTPSNVLSNSMSLYFKVKAHLLERGGRLFIKDSDGNTTEIEVA